MCSSVSELAVRLVELRCPPVEVGALADFVVGMARVLETAQVAYVEAVTNAALAAGTLSFGQARTIAGALRVLEPETVAQIEATLVGAVAAAEPAAAAALCAHAVELATPAGAVGRARVRARRRRACQMVCV